MTGRIRVGTVLALVVLAGAGVLAGLAAHWLFKPAASQIEFTSTGPTVVELEKLGDLVPLRVHVADVLQGRDGNFWGEIKGAWIIRGDALYAVDMRQAKFLDRDEQARRAVVRLPRPRLIQPRIDHERTKTYDFSVGMLRTNAEARSLYDNAMLQAQKLVISAASSEDFVDQARRTTEQIVRELFRAVDWDVAIQWEDQPAPASQP